MIDRRVEPISRDDTGDMRTVPVVVVGLCAIIDEIDPSGKPRSRQEEIVMQIDAAVDDCNADSCATEPIRTQRHIRSDCRVQAV